MPKYTGHTQERVATGKLVPATNLPKLLATPVMSDDVWSGNPLLGDSMYRNRAAILQGRVADLEAVYGYGSVETGNAIDHRTGKATGVPGMIGVYIPREAYDAAIESVERTAES